MSGATVRSVASSGDAPGPNHRHTMGEKTDKISGRAKQAAGAVTGDEDLKHEGERQEDKGKLKGNLDEAVDKAQDVIEDLKDKATGNS